MKFAYHSVILSNAKDDTTFTDIEGTCSILHLISLIINKYLAYSLSEGGVNMGNLRETFFFNQMRVNNPIVTSSIADFQIGGRTFEVGGKSKGLRQIASAEQAYVVKDGIEFSSANILPLWWFGLNY